MTALQEEEVLPIFVEANDWEKFELRGRHPSAVLLLLISGNHSLWYGWKHANESKLLPLHDDDCCKSWKGVLTPEGRAHVAACNALTVVAHILNSTDEQRQSAGYTLYRIAKEKQLEENIVMLGDDRARIPSPEFVNVLRLAGLDEWLELGSTFDTEPRHGPKHNFLTIGDGRFCVRILRTLAEYVNFEAYFERATVAAQPHPPMTSPILGTDPNSEHPPPAQSIADVSDDPPSFLPRNIAISTIDANVESARALPADPEHGASGLATFGEDAAAGSSGGRHEGSNSAVDPVELGHDPATVMAAQLFGERGQDETDRAGAPELEMVTIAHDRDEHTENREASDEAALNARAQADVDMNARPRTGVYDTGDGPGQDEMGRAGAPELEMVTVDSDRDAHVANRGPDEAAVIDARAGKDAGPRSGSMA
ncbi:unnamed protein product [Peniophora sp. CBMAI 1063]|nr:unnamed protein product [Peniophora sp. CBMAI 1063]